MTTQTNNFPEMDLSLALSKAEGNLKFLAQAELANFTQGESVLEALHSVQQARKHWVEVIRKQREETQNRVDTPALNQ
jgi:hypothetical protein